MRVKYLIQLIITLFIFVGCGNESSFKSDTSQTETTDTNTTVQTVTGTFIDDAVGGLDYNCTSGTTGTTNADGEFTCNIGDDVTFFIGDVQLGTVAVSDNNPIITPYNLFQNYTYPDNVNGAVNLARLLQSIDSDNNATNGVITLDTTKTVQLPRTLNLTDTALFETTITDTFNPDITLETANDANIRMNAAIESAGGTVPSDGYLPVANAGADQSIYRNETVSLNGSSSIYANSYDWDITTKPSGSTASLSSTTIVNPTFVADLNGTYIIELKVTYGSITSIVDSITVVANNALPVPTLLTIELNEDTNANGTLTATDANSDNLTYAITANPTQGTLSYNALSSTFTYIPDANYNGSDSFTYSVDDGVGSSVTKVVSITVTAVNDAPIMTQISSVAVAENQTTVLTLTASDIDNDTLVYSLIESNTTIFDINSSSGLIIFKDAPDYEFKNSYTIQVFVSDAIGSDSQFIDINITNIQENPTIADTNGSIDENATIGTVVLIDGTGTTISILDHGDTSIDGMTLTGTGYENFTIDKYGNITLAAGVTLDYETKTVYNLKAYAQNSITGTSNEIDVIIKINNIIEGPILNDLTANVTENSLTDTVVGNITIDSVGDNAIVSIAINDGASGGSSNFYIETDGTLKVRAGATLNYETWSSGVYKLIATASNSVLTSNTVNITINLLNIDEKPVLDDLEIDIFENIAPSAFVGKVNISDYGDSDISSFTLSGTGSENFDIDLNGTITLNVGAVIDYEVVTSYSLSAVATNDASSSDVVTVTVNVKDIVDTVAVLENMNLSIYESVDSNDTFGPITISDSGDTAIISIVVRDKATSLVSPNFEALTDGTLKVKSGVTLDYETKTEYNLTAEANNGAGLSDVVDLTININNVVDTVAILSATVGSIDENVTVGTSVADINITQGDSVISTISLSGTGYENFQVNKDGNITVKVGASFDYETTTEYNLTAKALNGAGYSLESSVRISVNNVGEVAILSDTTASIQENKGSATLVGSINITAGDSVISDINLSGTGNENFLVSISGDITLSSVSSLDYETTTKYNLTAIAYNATGGSASADVNISVDDYAYTPFQIAKLKADDAEIDDLFGSSVAVSGNYIVVGTPNEDTTAVNSGSVYLFKKSNDGSVSQIAKVGASNPASGDNFGKSVSISGSYFVVGSPNTDFNATDSGSAYIFKIDSNDTVSEIDILYAKNDFTDDIGANDLFGSSVAISGEYIVVGSPLEDGGGVVDTGSAYLFMLNTVTDVVETEVNKMVASDAVIGDNFGNSVSLDGVYIVVGAYKSGTDAGSAYVFKIDTVNLEVVSGSKIEAEVPQDQALFGNSVSLSGNYIIVGAYHEDGSEIIFSGSAYLYKITNESSVAFISKIIASDASSSDYFGSSVSISGKYIVIGASQDDKTFVNSGSAYVYTIDTTNNSVALNRQIIASISGRDDYFGNSVSISGDYIAVSAYNEDSIALNSGSVYLYDSEPIEKIYIYNETATFSIDENLSKDITKIDAGSPNGVLSYDLITGVDKDSFTMNGNVLSNSVEFDYEAAIDSDVNNNYIFTVDVSDNLGSSKSFNISIDVKDKYYLDLARVISADANASDYFGSSVASSGDYIVIGAPYDDTTQPGAGSAYVYKKKPDGSVVWIKSLQASTPQNSANFGNSVDISGNYIVVGSSNEDHNSTTLNSGAAYVYEIIPDVNVTLVGRVEAGDIEAEAKHGYSVSVDDVYVVVGSPYEDAATLADSGSTYMYKIISSSSVGQIAKILPSDAAVNDYFGTSVSMSGVYILVGAFGEDATAVVDSGSAYMFEKDSDAVDDVSEKEKINATTPQVNANYGNSLSLDGDYMVIGSFNEDNITSNAGSAYIYKKDGFGISTLIQKVIPSDIGINNNFANSVDISGSFVAIGASNEDTSEVDSGAIYVYKIASDDSNATEVEKIMATNVEKSAFFGKSVSIDGNFISVGASQEDGNVSDSGVFYLFEKDTNQP